MTIITPTRLRKNLFSTLHRALRGEVVSVHTREGNVVLVPEKKYIARRRRHEDPMKPKIPGWIVGNLDDADKALRRYIRLP